MMINQQELTKYVKQAVPELSGALQNETCKNAYDVMRQLFTYTATQVVHHNLTAAKKCLTLAEQLYQKGNAVIKNAIENVFVFSFSHAFFCDEKKRLEVMPIVPPALYDLYKKQVINSHL